jgi:hypothetical protein
MYQYRIDVEHGLLVGLFSGATNSEDDYQRYVDSILEASEKKLTVSGGIAMLVVERGNPIPNAAWRKRIADASGDLGTKDVLFILCSGDPLMRGVATAINWIRPPKYELKVVASLPDLVEVVRQRRPSAAPRVDEIIRELQLRAT